MACLPSNNLLCYLTDKAFKSLYTLLLVVLMTLWIVISVESGRQLQELSLRTNHGTTRLKPEDARRLPGSLASAAIITTASRSSLSRLYGLTVFNTLLEEAIALGALVSLFTRARRLFCATLALLTIIWFIEQYRISDFYHQIDHIDYQSGQILIATHVLHFLVILVGIFLYLLIDEEGEEYDEAKLIEGGGNGKRSSEASAAATADGNGPLSPLTLKSNPAFADLEKHGSSSVRNSISSRPQSTIDHNNHSGHNGTGNGTSGYPEPQPPKKPNRCAWMRSTFVKVPRATATRQNQPEIGANSGNKGEEVTESSATATAAPTAAMQSRREKQRSKSQVTVISGLSSNSLGRNGSLPEKDDSDEEAGRV